MKLIRFRTPAGVALGCVAGSGVVDLTRRDPALQDMAALLTQGGSAAADVFDHLGHRRVFGRNAGASAMRR